jgi:Arrestin (or S-antigen), C-terminal domain
LASSAPRGCIYPTLLSQQQLQQHQHQLHQQQNASYVASGANQPSLAPSDEKNVFAIYVSYYVKVKLTLSAMGGVVSLKLPFILGNIDMSEDKGVSDGSGGGGNGGGIIDNPDKHAQSTHLEDLHLNDHQRLSDIRRPNFDRSESISEGKFDGNTNDLQLLSRNSSVNCKSIDYDDVIDVVNDINNEGIEFINQKFSEMNRRDSNRSTDSSVSDEIEESKQEINVIQAQVHCQKYLESDI